MQDFEQKFRPISNIINSVPHTTRHRRSQRQRISPSPEPQLVATVHSVSPIDASQNRSASNTDPSSSQTRMPHQSLATSQPADSRKFLTTDNAINSSGDLSFQSSPNISSVSANATKNLSTSDLDTNERKKQAALAKVQEKLERAQRLYQSAQLSVEQNISEFLRVTTLPGVLTESNSSKVNNAAFDKRIRMLQDTKKELEKKISNYQSDLLRIQNGDIPHQYSSSKDILHSIKSKVTSGTNKQRSSNDLLTSSLNESSSLSLINTPTATTTTTITSPTTDPDNQSFNPQGPSVNLTGKSTNNSQNFLTIHSNNSNSEVARTSPSNSICNEIGNSQFYIDSNYDQGFDNDNSTRKQELLSPDDFTGTLDVDRSPLSKRRYTNESINEYNDHTSDQSSDDRYASFNQSKRNTMTSHEHHQLMIKIDLMQKCIDRYESRANEMQKQIDGLATMYEAQRNQNERLNNELADLIELHQFDTAGLKTDLRKLEDKLVYNFHEDWNKMMDELEKLETRTAKVEQTQTYSIEPDVHTHRIITKLVNILLTVFAIILLLLSTIKNLLQSRVHAVILLILVFTWIGFHYLPDNWFQTPLFSSKPSFPIFFFSNH